MVWILRFLPAALEELDRLDKSGRERILNAIHKKLTVDPRAYGQPLRRELFGLWKLRVGEYRVIYLIREAAVTVVVVKVGIRRDEQVYNEMLARLRDLPPGNP